MRHSRQIRRARWRQEHEHSKWVLGVTWKVVSTHCWYTFGLLVWWRLQHWQVFKIVSTRARVAISIGLFSSASILTRLQSSLKFSSVLVSITPEPTNERMGSELFSVDRGAGHEGWPVDWTDPPTEHVDGSEEQKPPSTELAVFTTWKDIL